MQLGGAEQSEGRGSAATEGAGAPDPGSVAEVIARARTAPEGVLFQTTHWREQSRRQMTVAMVVILFAFLGDDLVTATIIAVPLFALMATIGSARRRSCGLLITPEGAFARWTVGRPVPIETARLLEQKPARMTTMAAGPSDYFGYLLPPHRWRFVPGLRARGVVAPFGSGLLPKLSRLLVGQPARLTSRPLRPWYRRPARTTVHHDVIWCAADDGRALQAVLGFGPPLAPAVGSPDQWRGDGAADTPSAEPTDERYEQRVLRASGRVRVSAVHLPAILAFLALTFLLMAFAKFQILIDYDRFETIGIAFAIYLPVVIVGMLVFLTRSVTVTTEGLRVRNGPVSAQRIPWADVAGLTVPRRGRTALQLDTPSGPIRLKGLVFSDRRTVLSSLAPQAIEWACTPYGLGRRTVASSTDAVVLLEELFRSRGWQQPEDWVAPPIVVERVGASATRLERWNRDAA